LVETDELAGLDVLDGGVLNHVGGARAEGLTLEEDGGGHGLLLVLGELGVLSLDLVVLTLELTLDLLVLLDTVQEVLAALGVADVLNADVDTLGEDAATNALVDLLDRNVKKTQQQQQKGSGRRSGFNTNQF